ncbi:ABC transporter permease [Paenibacillus planticolens]|uniref:ABC transporter permease subunit n=1 Tax=Paenibacillus planticolens TaxID=2654976 RepID=A0ABX1ZS01_9BACL|nr:ABC transporter permease subunit [Paenibacillus planticolens]NOV01609.1 ABC transporter permease subunit [Paenibacillus planticolens]
MKKLAAVAASAHSGVPAGKRRSFLYYLWRDRYLYLFLLPALGFYLIFKYSPLYGEIIAFKDFQIMKGIWGSPWAGLKHFRVLLSNPDFWLVFRNTMLLNLYKLLFVFPAPIVLALMLNEIRSNWFKRTIQNLLYLPHFISWVVLGGVIVAILSPSTGVINTILEQVFGIEPIYFMTHTGWWPVMFTLSSNWQGAGWGTILYLAAMANIDPQQYEAAKIDGASKLRQIWHVTLPGIRPTIALLLILQMGQITDVGFEQVYNLQNEAVFSVSDVISTYVYRMGLQAAQYSYSTAVGLFQGVIALILMLTVNKITKAMGESGLW